MKTAETIFFISWLLAIFLYQFYEPFKTSIKKFNFIGLIPSFHLFSPKPFLGLYVIRYEVHNASNPSMVTNSREVRYLEETDLFHANKKVIKCINNLCRGASGKPISYSNARLLKHFVMAQISENGKKGKFQFSVSVRYKEQERIKYKSRVYDL